MLTGEWKGQPRDIDHWGTHERSESTKEGKKGN